MTFTLSNIQQRIAHHARIAFATWNLWMANRTVRECEALINYAKNEVRKSEAAYAVALGEAADAKVVLEKLQGDV